MPTYAKKILKIFGLQRYFWIISDVLLVMSIDNLCNKLQVGTYYIRKFCSLRNYFWNVNLVTSGYFLYLLKVLASRWQLKIFPKSAQTSN